MREIKYRQRLVKGAWHYWGFIDGTFISPMLSDGVDDALKHSQQFTGILDKNGIDIYEGDLLKWHDDVLEVRWVSVGWDLFSKLFKRFGLPDGSTCSTTNTRGYTRNSEVIGTIYENPELLTSQQGSGKAG